MALEPAEVRTGLEPHRGGVGAVIRHVWARIRHYAREPQAPPPRGERLERLCYGAAHPLLGLKLLFRDPELLREGLVPAAWLAGFCALIAFMSTPPADATEWAWRLQKFYTTFAVLAPVPSVVFANHYARMSALARWRLGLGACGPREQSLGTILGRFVRQTVLVAAGLIPITAVLHILPGGAALDALLLGAWALHWVVIDAFDDARVLQPGETLAQLDRAAELAPRPWFVRFFHGLADRAPAKMPRALPRMLHRFAEWVDRLSKPWREEIALVEKNPVLSGGFALATGILLATPVLNLLFRPLIIAGSANLLHHLEVEERADQAAAEAALAARAQQALPGRFEELEPPPEPPRTRG